MTDQKDNNGLSTFEVPQSDITLSTLVSRRRSGHEVPVGCYDEDGAAFVRRHTSHVRVSVVVHDSGPPLTAGVRMTVDVEDDDVAARGGVHEQQRQHRGVRRHGQLQQPAVLVERQDGTAGARRDVPDVDAEAADVSVAAVARRQTEMILDKHEPNVGRHGHAVHRTFVHLFMETNLFHGRTRTAYLYRCVWSGITGR